SKIPAGQASSFINLVPVFTIILGWMILGERFTFIQFMGVIIVFAGVALSQWKGSEDTNTLDTRVKL
ncbi:MAG: EamA family transporter, partial [Desulfonatronovibrio sp.]|nr:DMT family transporter [Desulfovibrionales bacterium]